MPNQPADTGRNIPTAISSRVRIVGPKKPLKADPAKCGKMRAAALKKQRATLEN